MKSYHVFVGTGKSLYVCPYITVFVEVHTVPPSGLKVTVYVPTVAHAVNCVFCVIVTVVSLLFTLAGVSQLFFVHLFQLYPTCVVAQIFTCFPYLYVHHHVVVRIPVHFDNVNV